MRFLSLIRLKSFLEHHEICLLLWLRKRLWAEWKSIIIMFHRARSKRKMHAITGKIMENVDDARKGQRTLCFTLFYSQQLELSAFVNQIENNDNNFFCLCIAFILLWICNNFCFRKLTNLFWWFVFLFSIFKNGDVHWKYNWR